MTLYSIALGLHLLCVLAGAAASAMALQSALRLRAADDLAGAQSALTEIRRIVRVFPPATLGLLATGGYMTHTAWTWTTSWIVASIAGLVLISVLGSKVEGGRMKRLGAEIARHGLTPAARQMTHDPVAWTAKCGTLTLLVAVVLEMSLKPEAMPAAAVLLLALAAAVPLGKWFARAEGHRVPVAPEPAASEG